MHCCCEYCVKRSWVALVNSSLMRDACKLLTPPKSSFFLNKNNYISVICPVTYAEILNTSYYHKNLSIYKKLKNSVMPKKIHCGKRHFLLLIETGITDFFYNLYIDCSYLKGTLG